MADLGFAGKLGLCLTTQIALHWAGPLALKTLLRVLCPATSRHIPLELQTLSRSRASNLRRLIRSVVYCSVASGLGVYLLSRYYRSIPHDFLFLWNEEIDTAFVFAISHWIVSVFEDTAAYEHLNRVFLKTAEDKTAIRSMYSNLLAHHVVTLFAYSWSLSSAQLSGLCVLGLCFEAPVVFMSLREIIIVYDDIFGLIPSIRFAQLRLFWIALYVTWHAGRSLPCLLYPISLLIWRAHLNQLPPASFYVYHLLGLVFCFTNLTLLFRYIAKYLQEDMQRVGLALRRDESDSGAVTYSVKQALSENEESNLIRSSRNGNVARLMGMQEVALHDSADDCFVVVSGKVYDVTGFLSEHPGGAKALLLYAGKDATAAFNETGHSAEARARLRTCHVADLLAHGYDQVSKAANTFNSGSAQGDTSAPYLLFKTYFNYDNPVFPLLLCTQMAYRTTKSLLSTPSEHPLLHSIGVFLQLMSITTPMLVISLLPCFQSFFYPRCKSLRSPQPSTSSVKVLRHLLSWRLHVAAMAWMGCQVGDMTLMLASTSFSAIRTSLLLTSLLEFIISDCHSFYSKPSCLLSVNPCTWMRGLVSILENSNHRAQLFLLSAVALDIASTVSMSGQSLLVTLPAVGLSRLLFFRSLHMSVEALQGDFFGACVLISFLSMIYGAGVLSYASGWSVWEVLQRYVLQPVLSSKSWDVLMQGIVVGGSLISTASVVHWSRPSFANHMFSLGNAALLWPFNSSAKLKWLTLPFFVLTLQGQNQSFLRTAFVSSSRHFYRG